MCGKMYLLKFCYILFCLIGSHGPLLPLPSRYRMGSRDTPELVAYPLPQASSSYMHGGNPSGSVVMVSGLHQLKMNCSRVFNLFCLYGNIEKVSFILYQLLLLGYVVGKPEKATNISCIYEHVSSFSSDPYKLKIHQVRILEIGFCWYVIRIGCWQ